ncbi:hypothetical protein [Micromonospora halophytica]|uniref:Uncharacterized protein n=1 Tax=Micromonospora halophytica TaxID=47864 RepID=A0A1C5IKW4_9ACTN|nr:hypothetical protein [Micromonospora halophytica]SCG58945.1 hypothetical protein GA0070560_11333 [Micromonospora halophytica]
MSVEGFWKVAVATPFGTRRTELELFTKDGALQGISRGEKETLTLKDLRLEGDRLSWYQSITKPMRMDLVFDVVVDGDEMTGTARGGPMPAAKVSGHRETAAQPA